MSENNTIKISIYIDPSEAVKAGKCQSGHFSFPLTEENLQALSEEDRQLIVNHVTLNPDKVVSGSINPLCGMVEPTFEGVLVGLANLKEELAKEKQEKEKQEARKKQNYENEIKEILKEGPSYFIDNYSYMNSEWSIDNWRTREYEEKRTAPLIAEATKLIEEHNKKIKQQKEQAKQEKEKEKQEKEEKNRLFYEALDAFTKANGTKNQIERLAADVLPEEEKLDLLRTHLFKPFNDFDRYKKIKNSEVIDCLDEDENPYPNSDKIEYEKEEMDELSSDQWDVLKEFKQIAPKNAQLVCREHTGYYDEVAQIHRYSITVIITWHNRKFSRRFALPDFEEFCAS